MCLPMKAHHPIDPSPARSGLRRNLLAACAAGLALASCFGTGATPTSAAIAVVPSARTFVPSLPVGQPPFNDLQVSWLQRMDDMYVFFDVKGSYTDTAAHIPTLLREMKVQGLEPAGPPFCLFYDDPAQKPVRELRSRACVPIEGYRSPRSPLDYNVLESRTVVYAFVSGPYPNAPRAYPKLFEEMRAKGWQRDGPILERYIVPPSEAAAPSDFICEIQIPFTRGE